MRERLGTHSQLFGGAERTLNYIYIYISKFQSVEPLKSFVYDLSV